MTNVPFILAILNAAFQFFVYGSTESPTALTAFHIWTAAVIIMAQMLVMR